MLSFEDDDVPGGSGYKDVTSVLLDAASGISPEGMLAMKNFSLHDAMMAIEAMDPRMDSGIERPEYPKGTFDPYAPLLPEEVCWIIDRTFAAEMSWHSGHSLSQTVFTCLYTHEIAPGRMWSGNQNNPGRIRLEPDSRRPIQLVSLVLKAAIYGLLKSCDLAWRELTKNHVIEMEDFNGEKSDRFMCETISEAEVLGMLDAAKLWLVSKQASSISMRAELIARIELRRSILVTISTCLSAEVKQLKTNLRVAHVHLRDIRTLSTPISPTAQSPAYHAFDPAIARRLLSVMPLKIIPLPDQTGVWDDYVLLFNSIHENFLMTDCSSILHIKELLELRAYQPPLANRTGLVRSFSYPRIKTALLKRKGDFWGDQLFSAMATVSSTTILMSMPIVLTQQTPLVLKTSVDKMAQEYFASFFSNRPRQRRRLCNWMSECAMIPIQLHDLMTSVASKDNTNLPNFHRLFLAVSILRLLGASHIVLAGLELDIHHSNELPFIFWYGAVVYSTLNESLEVLRKDCAQAGPAILDPLFYEMMWSSLMGQYLMASCTTSLLLDHSPTSPPAREDMNLRRRFKWAFDSSEAKSAGDDGSVQPANRADPCAPRFHEWKAFRELQRQESPWTRAQNCGTVFQKLEDSLKAYEDVVQAEHNVASTEQLRPILAQAVLDSQTAQEQSARLRLELLREMKETASANSKRLLAIREPVLNDNIPKNIPGGSASAASGPSIQLPLFKKEGGSSRWFPTVC